MRRLAGDDPEVNEEWISDKDRFAFRYPTLEDRLTYPLVRDEETGELVTASWPEALAVAARGLAAARDERGVGVLTGGRLTVEDAYAYAKFARVVLNTNDIDFRARVHSAEEADFLAGLAGAGLRSDATRIWRRHPPSCWSAWIPRRRQRRSSCGCARPFANVARRCSRWRRSPAAGWPSWPQSWCWPRPAPRRRCSAPSPMVTSGCMT